MATLLFIGTVLIILILIIGIVIKTLRHKSLAASFTLLGIIFLTYTLLWTIFYFKSSNKEISLGTDICFDDWCVTVTKIERQSVLGNQKPSGQFIILHLKMSNQAKGIAQKPSEPRIHIKDEKENSWTFSAQGQKALENLIGNQIPIDQKLELHQSVETQLVFDIPQGAKKLYVLIEEGPFITKLLLQDDNQVFLIH